MTATSESYVDHLNIFTASVFPPPWLVMAVHIYLIGTMAVLLPHVLSYMCNCLKNLSEALCIELVIIISVGLHCKASEYFFPNGS